MRYSISNAIPHNPKSEKHPYENLVKTGIFKTLRQAVTQRLRQGEVLGAYYT